MNARGGARGAGPGEGSPALRAVAILAQAATIVATWSLWQSRADPPPLPLLALPQVDFGPLLLATLAIAWLRPGLGALLHALALLAAILADQTREQPQVLSLALLVAAASPLHGARAVGLLHVVALWLWSGLGKLTSETFLRHGGAWLIDAAPGSAGTAAAIGLGGVEVALAVLLLVPRTRRRAAWLGAAFHVAILVYLSPLGRDWNHSVWAWNAALAIAVPLLVRGSSPRSPLPDRAIVSSSQLPSSRATSPTCRPHRAIPLRAAALAFVVLPIGFHAGVVDAPLSHCVYAQNGARAVWLRDDGSALALGELRELGVLLPPVPRVLEQWFEAHASPGDRLVVVDGRPLAGLLFARERVVTAPLRGAP